MSDTPSDSNLIEQKLDAVPESTLSYVDDGASIESSALFEKFSHKVLGQLLQDAGKITEEQVQEALAEQRGAKKHLGQILIDMELITENDLLECLAHQMDLPFLEDLPVNDIDPDLVRDLRIGFCKEHTICPISRDDFGVTVAVYDSMNMAPIDDLRLVLGANIHRVVVPRKNIERAINAVFEKKEISEEQDSNLQADDDEEIEGLETSTDLLNDEEEAPVRREVASILRRAIGEEASDIHIEPYEERVVVRFRVDGRLSELKTISKRYQSSVISRIKILAGMDIGKDRVTQDGRISIKLGKEYDVRVSSLPTKFGERIVMRILDKSGSIMALTDAGMPPKVFSAYGRMLQQKQGIILVTGPTGSGKTATLASSIMQVKTPDMNIITVEDPVEYVLPGVSQVEVQEKIGLTFSSALRSILRQDPDVILIGEIRDDETAQIAFKAAITGHLVLSTLHTNDTASTVTRLSDLGLEPYQITTSVLGVVAVRLISKLCPTCKEPVKHTPEELELAGLQPMDVVGKTLYKARANGCSACKNLGYKGRTGIFELLVLDEEIRNYILRSSDGSGLRRLAIQRGMVTLKGSAVTHFLRGSTSLEQVVRATRLENLD